MNKDVRKVVCDAVSARVTNGCYELKDDTDIVADLGADSLDVAEIAMDLEDDLNFKFREGDEEKLKKIKDIVKMVEKYTNKTIAAKRAQAIDMKKAKEIKIVKESPKEQLKKAAVIATDNNVQVNNVLKAIVFRDPFRGRKFIFISDILHISEIYQDGEEFTYCATGINEITTRCLIEIHMRYGDTYHYAGTLATFLEKVEV